MNSHGDDQVNKTAVSWLIAALVAVFLGIFTDGFDAFLFFLALVLGYEAGRSVGHRKRQS